MKLIVCEKPSQGREVAAAIGVKKKKDGYMEGPGIIVTWMEGHVMTLAEPQDYDDRYKAWKFENLPILPHKIKFKVAEGRKDKHGADKAKKQFSIIKSFMLSESIKEIYCTTDPDREGELIFREVYNHVRCKKPVKRVWLKSLTPSAITSAIAEAKDFREYDALYYDALSGSIGDWLVGINASRATTLYFKQETNDGTYSIGRVQTPTLSLIVNREKEINDFVQLTYYVVDAEFEGLTGIYYLPSNGDMPLNWIPEKQDARDIKEKVNGKKGVVTNVEFKEKQEKPPLLYSLDDLRTDCSSAYGYTADQTLKIVQLLYERKFVTYPRTDSCYISSKDEVVLPVILDSIKSRYPQFVSKIQKNNYKMMPELIDDSKVTGHSALIPTETPYTGGLSDEHTKVYDLICRRFICTYYPNYSYISYSAEIEVPDAQVDGRFISSGTRTLDPGWKYIYKDDDQDDDENEEYQALLKIKENGENVELDCNKVNVTEHKTRPKSRYTDGSLIEAMKTSGKMVSDPEARAAMKGIGTPATRGSIIEKLIYVGYVQRVGKSIYATPKGINLIDKLKSELLKSPEMTGEWEKKRAKIKTQEDMDEFIDSIKLFVRDFVRQMKEDAGFEGEEPEIDLEIPRKVEKRNEIKSDDINIKTKVKKEKIMPLIKPGATTNKSAEVDHPDGVGTIKLIQSKESAEDLIKRLLSRI